MSSEILEAVHSDDLETLLESLGVLDDVQQGRSRCSVCNDSVSIKSISGIYPEKGKVLFLCEKQSCVEALLRQRALADG